MLPHRHNYGNHLLMLKHVEKNHSKYLIFPKRILKLKLNETFRVFVTQQRNNKTSTLIYIRVITFFFENFKSKLHPENIFVTDNGIRFQSKDSDKVTNVSIVTFEYSAKILIHQQVLSHHNKNIRVLQPNHSIGPTNTVASTDSEILFL